MNPSSPIAIAFQDPSARSWGLLFPSSCTHYAIALSPPFST
ncbi:hypothetical protein [Scytonema sp. UIC 10036]|nr:hypothetical protein [Scytonema sp. UIC 10036]